MRDTSCEILKRGALGVIARVPAASGPHVVRDTSAAAFGLGWLARRLARRERAALRRAAGIDGIPSLRAFDDTRLVRDHLPGAAMHVASFDAAPYFADALRLLRRLHRCGIAHNDLAKEANWICMPGNRAGIVDFQLATISPRRRWLFRVLAREDLRHLLKHRRHYAAHLLTRRQRRVLEQPSVLAWLWQRGFKPIYRVVTRRMLGWPDRSDAHERQWPAPASTPGDKPIRYDSRPASRLQARR